MIPMFTRSFYRIVFPRKLPIWGTGISVRLLWEHLFVQNARMTKMERLCGEIAELYAHISSATACWLMLLAQFDALGFLPDGYKTVEHWLSWSCGISLGTARDHVRTARRLRDRPLIAQAMERGELSYSKVRALMRLDEDFDEQLMLNYARYAS